jgi:Peptidase family S41/N-terminal domain of Peptidase_S41 in eukaryotic IRBP
MRCFLLTLLLPLALSSMPIEASVQAVDSRAVAKSLAQRLVSDYVYPDRGARYASALSTQADAGAYDALAGAELALKLTADLQAVARDGHLRVMYQGAGGGPRIVVRRPPDAAGAPAAPGTGPVMVRMTPPPAMEHARWLAPGVAFVRFNLFPGGPGPTEAVRRFMDTYAGAEVVIFDLRTHLGGGLDEMDVIFPALFSEPTALVRMAARKSVDAAGRSPISDHPTLRVVQADPEFVTREHWVTPSQDRRWRNAKVFVLTSGLTASAGEHFALAFKQTRRGTLIGGTTHGAAHFGGDQDLGGEYTTFIPVGRAYDPTTGKDWEGTGIAPDIETAPADALIEALTRSGVPRAEATRLSGEVAPTMPMIDRR